MPELTVIETLFTRWQSLAGGVLIGLASVLLMLSLGRIMGATGVLPGVLTPSAHPDAGWRLALLSGMISGPLVVLAATGQMPAVEVPVSVLMLLVGGLLVGIGVTFGSGCTSGHGVCGIARLSRRFIGHGDRHADHRIDAATLYDSIRKLLTLPDETRLFICHDHGPNGRDIQWETTVAAEMENNIHVGKGATKEQFVKFRTERDATLAMLKLIIPSLQVNMRAGEVPTEKDGRPMLKVPVSGL